MFRDDPKDPRDERVNRYDYNLVTELAGYYKLPGMIIAASTSFNDNMGAFCDENVFYEKRVLNDGFVHRSARVPDEFDWVRLR